MNSQDATFMDINDFINHFKPKTNHLLNPEDVSFNGWMYETYGEELSYILEIIEQKKNLVWSIIEDVHCNLIFVNGFRDNSIGHLVCEVPYDNSSKYIIQDKDDLVAIVGVYSPLNGENEQYAGKKCVLVDQVDSDETHSCETVYLIRFADGVTIQALEQEVTHLNTVQAKVVQIYLTLVFD